MVQFRLAQRGRGRRSLVVPPFSTIDHRALMDMHLERLLLVVIFVLCKKVCIVCLNYWFDHSYLVV